MVKTLSKIVKAIPSTESGGRVVCFTKSNCSGEEYIVTENPLKAQYTLWKRVDGGFEKIKTSDNPLDFDSIIPFEKGN